MSTSWFGSTAAIAGVRIAGVLIAAWLLTALLHRLVRRIEAKVSDQTSPIRALQRTETMTKVLSAAGIVVIWSLAGIYVIRLLGFDLAPLLAGVGVIGLAVGFGAQGLVRDVVAGFFILFEDQYGVGDTIEINQVASGKVEQLTMRITGLRDLDGTMHYVANGQITHVANRSKEWARAIVDIGVGYREDPDRVRGVLERVGADAKSANGIGSNLITEPEILGVEALGEYEVVWRVVADTKPARQWQVARELRERIKVAFDREGIEIPYPHRVMIRSDGSSKDEDPGE